MALAKSLTDEFLDRPMADVVELLASGVLLERRMTLPGLYSIWLGGFGLLVMGLLDILLLLLFVLLDVGSENFGFGMKPVNRTSPFCLKLMKLYLFFPFKCYLKMGEQ